MLCVGYSDPDRVFIVRNSWGRSWGDRGYCYIPYDYLLSDRYNHGDSWTIRQMTILEEDEETWEDDEDSISDGEDDEPKAFMGARGAAASSRLKESLRRHPRLFSQAILRRACEALEDSAAMDSPGLLLRYITEEIPVQGQKALGRLPKEERGTSKLINNVGRLLQEQ